ncbi:uncharacterized protein BYT42DRAFT_61122 [Radiomyces spectabilis]|uniref:uncharacterized protein n=1 Tax=Radiomyces spectabilis TaxID=64574 RepID=UPI00221F08C3|nr:uncharacterized protein BYT42DRAFT_61122 [Radiomyces spectabilis]KAI8373193.1 hypothetical protein BYT42DRAFT_61122 [Radiomyces spectabilis]
MLMLKNEKQDIDDTIKVTDILGGKDVILQNTFFSKAKEVPGMAEVYRAWAAEKMPIHYVSNSPWQVYPAISDFIEQYQFPKGSMHLRVISTTGLIRGKPGRHKMDVITQILEDFPMRKFILVGDSGEIDPEIYHDIYHLYPHQIIKIFIHDVSSERAVQFDRRVRKRSDSYYESIRKFITRDNNARRRTGTSTQTAMDAMVDTEVPQEQQMIMDANVPLQTKLEEFEARMKRVSSSLPDNVFSVFNLASQLLLDPVVAEQVAAYKENGMMD